MDLKTYIHTAKGNATQLAARLDIPLSYLSQMANGDRAITEKRASQIEAATDGQVPRWHTRPEDWWEIWPELIQAKGAPATPRSRGTRRASVRSSEAKPMARAKPDVKGRG